MSYQTHFRAIVSQSRDHFQKVCPELLKLCDAFERIVTLFNQSSQSEQKRFSTMIVRTDALLTSLLQQLFQAPGSSPAVLSDDEQERLRLLELEAMALDLDDDEL